MIVLSVRCRSRRVFLTPCDTSPLYPSASAGEHSSDHASSPHASTHIAHRTGLTALGQANKSMSPGVVAGPHRCRAHRVV